MLLENELGFSKEILIIVGVIIFVSIIVSLFKTSGQNCPPGPWGLPLVGYIPFLTKDAHLQFINFSKKYGKVFSLRLGPNLVVILNDSKSIMDSLTRQEFLGRPPSGIFYSLGMKSPFFQNDMLVWKEAKRFVIQTLKELDLGTTKIEDLIQDEINHFKDVLMSLNCQPIDPNVPLRPSLSNTISSLIFGKRFEYEDTEKEVLDKHLDAFVKSLRFHLIYPLIKNMPPVLNWLGIQESMKMAAKAKIIFKRKVEEHKETLNRNNIRDLIDNYLIEMDGRQKKDANTTFTDEELLGCLSDLFATGSETLATSVAWLIYTMSGFPDVQEKIRKEILEVIGPDRNPEYMDRKSMPFTQAVILEVLRWRPVAALDIPRWTLAETHVAGYDIPAGTMVIANIFAVHHDPTHWEDPDTFKPERFLTTDVRKSSHYMPFGTGKRACPGETLAFMQAFLYFVSILQNFNVRFPEGYKPTFDGILGFTYRSPPTKISFIPINRCH